MTFSTAKQDLLRMTPRVNTSCLSSGVVMRALATSVALLSMNAQAQTGEPATPASAPLARQAQAVRPATADPAATAATQYTTSEKDLAFRFMDANHDGKISREEAAGFRNVAKHFDEADTNQDNALSREEFENALTRVKRR